MSNLGNAATELKLAYQDSKLAIAGDWDGDTQGNSGVFYAMKVAKQLRIPLFLPSTANGQKIDYNDIYKDFGEEGVKTRLAQKAYRLPVPQDRLSYLLKLLEYAPEAHLNQVIKGIASASLLGDKISVDDLSTKVHKIAEDRIERAEVSALLADFLRAKTKRLAKHSTISAESVDFQENFLAEVGENGNMKIPSMVLQRIEHHMGKDRIILLQSPTGTGKTQEVLKPLADKLETFIIGAPRKGLAKFNAGVFNADYYSDDRTGSKVRIVRESLCTQSFGSWRYYDGQKNKLLTARNCLVDEGDQAISQLLSLGNQTERASNFVGFRDCINEMSTILADAFLNENTVAQIKDIAPGKEIVHINIAFPQGMAARRETTLTDRPENVIEAMSQSTAKGEQSVLFTDSRATALRTHRFIQEKNSGSKGLVITDKPEPQMLPAIQRFFENPNGEIKNWDYVIMSPKVVSGVSITDNYFTKHYGIFTGVVQPNSAAQMLERDRTAKSILIAVPKRKTCRKSGPSLKTMRALELSISQYAGCVLRNYQNEVESRKDYASAILFALRKAGHETSVAQDAVFSVSKQTRLRLKELANEISDEEIERIISHPEYPAEMISNISKIELKTSIDHEILMSNKVRKELLIAPKKEDVKFLRDDGFRKLRHLECLNADDQKLEAYDTFEESNLDIVDRYHGQKRKKFLHGFLTCLGIDDQLFREFTGYKIKNAHNFCKNNWDEICFLFPELEDLRIEGFKYSLPLVKRILSQVGVGDLESSKYNGETWYSVPIAKWRQLDGYLVRRREAKISFLS